jgi:hypothetical protein
MAPSTELHHKDIAKAELQIICCCYLLSYDGWLSRKNMANWLDNSCGVEADRPFAQLQPTSTTGQWSLPRPFSSIWLTPEQQLRFAMLISSLDFFSTLLIVRI